MVAFKHDLCPGAIPEQSAEYGISMNADGKKTVVLTAAEYWQLRALTADMHAVDVEFALARADFDRRRSDANEKRNTLFTLLAERYGLNPIGRYRLDDVQCSIIEES